MVDIKFGVARGWGLAQLLPNTTYQRGNQMAPYYLSEFYKEIKPSTITQGILQEILHYDPNTGIFTWKKKTSRKIVAGDIAGCKKSYGYIGIRINGFCYMAHRLAWLYSHGYFPEHLIDHKDQNPTHNWISNLREVGKVCNGRNCGNSVRNTSGVKGVTLRNDLKKWTAIIRANRRNIYIGSFEDFDDAVCARLAVEQCVGWQGCDSSSPAYQHVRKIQKDYLNA